MGRLNSFHSNRDSGLLGQNGAVMVEFAICGLLLITTIIALIDIGRIFFIQSTLNKAADNALALAQKIENFPVDTRSLNPANPSQQAQLNDFITAVDEIEAEANSLFAASLISPPGSNGSARLVPISIYEKNATGNMILVRDIGVLRPGTSAKYTAPSGSSQWYAHPTHCNSSSPNCTSPLSATANWDITIKNEPLVIEVKAEVSTIIGGIIPILNQAILTGRAIGYREVLPKGAYAESFALPSASTSSITTISTTTTSTSTSVTTSVATSATSTSSSSVTSLSVSTTSTVSTTASSATSSTSTSSTSSTATSATSISSTSVSTISTTTTSVSCHTIWFNCWQSGGSYHSNNGACYCSYSG